MDDEDTPEVTREGLFEDLFGKVKEKTGELIDNEHMAEEGRHLQEIAKESPADDCADPQPLDRSDSGH